MNSILKFSLFLLLLTLCACGGDGPQEGTFVDSPVSGLAFETASQAGITDSQGGFSFSAGETVDFSLGDTLLGSAPGSAILSPFDLVGIQPITSARDIRAFSNRVFQGPVADLEKVFNMAIFLQALDEDGGLDNGIEIPDMVPTLLTGVQIDFGKKLDDFTDQVALLRLQSDGFSAGLWNGGRPLPNRGRAMDHLYVTLGLIPEILVSTMVTFDTNNDGTIDGGTKVFYDETGRLFRREQDLTGDGVADEIQFSIFNELDQVIAAESDTDGNGTIDARSTAQFDERGNQIQTETDGNNDGTPENIIKFFYNDLGQLIRSEFDNDGDGFPNNISFREINNDEKTVLEEQDAGADGTINSSSLRHFDAMDNEIQLDLDNNADGTVDTIITQQYDPNGNLIRREIDIGGDGSPEQIEIHEYDGNGFINLRVLDSDGNGFPNSISSFEHDELGNITKITDDNNADGIPDDFTFFHYDENGNPIMFEFDDGADGTINSVSNTGGYQPGNWVSFFFQLD